MFRSNDEESDVMAMPWHVRKGDGNIFVQGLDGQKFMGCLMRRESFVRSTIFTVGCSAGFENKRITWTMHPAQLLILGVWIE